MSYREWPPEQNYPEPNPSLRTWANRELLGILGTVNGIPRARMVWGQEIRERDRKIGSPNFHDGDDLRYPAKYRTLLRGWTLSLSDGTKTYTPLAEGQPEVPDGAIITEDLHEYAIGIPRYMVELWRAHTPLDAATYDPWLVNPADGQKYLVDSEDMGPGQYNRAFYTLITEHRSGCCTKSKRAGYKTCFAEYRDPCQPDLDYVASLWRQKEQEPAHFQQTEVIPPSLVEARTAARLSEIKDREQRRRAELRFRLRATIKDERFNIFNHGRVGYTAPLKP